MKLKDLNLPISSDQTKKAALGRGLKSLIPEATSGNAQPALTSLHTKGRDGSYIYQLPIEKVHPQKDQPRHFFNEEALKTLTDSIKQDGILQPVVVRQQGDHYELIAGERRWRAATKAGLATIPAIIKDISDEETFALALVENIQREDLTPIEEAKAYHRLMSQFHLTQEQVAARVGRERSTVSNTIRLLNLPEDLQPLVDEGQISAGHARALLSLSSVKEQRQLAKRVIDEHLSVRQAEHIAKLKKSAPTRPVTAPAAPSASAEISSAAVVEKLQRALGSKVTLNDHKGQGSIEIQFNSYAELDSIIQRITK